MITLIRVGLLVPMLLGFTKAQEPGKDLFQQAQGYWIVDFESGVTKALMKSIASEDGEQVDEEGMEMLRREMAASTFEIQEKVLRFHDAHSNEAHKLEVKSQNPEQKLIEAELTKDDEDPKSTRIVVMGDRITLSIKEDGELLEVGLKRIDKATFDQRIADIAKREEAADDVAREEAAPEPQLQGDYPFAIPVADKEGFVFSPYNRQVIDVRGLPKGTLVMDPTFPAADKKYFRVP